MSSYFENFWDLDIFSSSEVLDVIFALREKLSEESKNVDKVGLTFGDFCRIMKTNTYKDKMPNPVITYFISELVNRKILFRGMVVQCPNCYLKGWKALGHLRNRMACEGCGEAFYFLDIAKTRWKYKLNRLIMENFDPTIFLTLMREVGFLHQDLDSVVGYNFGFKADLHGNEELVAKLNGKEEIEIDFAMIARGQLCIGEAKQNPKDLTQEVVLNLIEFGRIIECDRVIIASIEHLHDLKAQAPSLQKTGYPEVEILDRDDLLYMTSHLYHMIEVSHVTLTGRAVDLENLEKRRKAYFDQYSLIAKNKAKIDDSLGEYFDI